MAVNFPNTPTLGQTVTIGNRVYAWNGVGWEIPTSPSGGSGGGGGASVTTDDVAPSLPKDGDMWLKTTTGALYVCYDDGNSKQWIQVSSSAQIVNQGYVLKTASAQNRVINGSLVMSQENASNTVTANGAYPADMWSLNYSGVSGQAVRTTTVLTPDGNNCAYVQSVSAAKASLAATDYVQNILSIEGVNIQDFQWGSAGAKQAMLRFNAFADVPGLYAVSIQNGGSTRAYNKGISLTTAWQTFVIPIPGDTTGTWNTDNQQGLSIRFIFAVGSTYTGVEGWQSGPAFGVPGMINGAAQANKSIFVSDVGFYLDPNKTGLAPPYERPLYMDEQMGCVRYWRSGQYRSGVPSGSTCGVVTPLVPPMRTIPTATYTDLIGTASKMTIGGNNGYTPSGGAPVVGSSEAGFDLVSPITMPNTWWGCLLKLSARM